jgi:altronate dehydratase
MVLATLDTLLFHPHGLFVPRIVSDVPRPISAPIGSQAAPEVKHQANSAQIARTIDSADFSDEAFAARNRSPIGSNLIALAQAVAVGMRVLLSRNDFPTLLTVHSR